MINEVRLDGRIGKDAEVRTVGSGETVLSFSIANTERKKQGDQWVDGETAWYDVTYWLKPGENDGDFKKGAYLCLKGRLKVDKWEKDGTKHSKVKVIMREVESWEFVKGGKSGADTNNGNKPAQSKPAQAQESTFDPNEYDSDIPF